MITRTPTLSNPYTLPTYFKALLIAQAFAAFLTETKFLPVKHNVGAFETVSVVFFVVTIAYFALHGLSLKFHRAMLPLFLMVIAAGMSNFTAMSDPSAYLDFRVLSCVILIISFTMAVAWFNVFLLDESAMDVFLRAITYSAAIISGWVLLDQIALGGAIGAAGPFRNRAHAGIYMHSALWLVLLRANWPRGPRWDRWLTYPVVAMILYVISGSGRRSIYIAAACGFLLLAALSMFTGGKARIRIGTMILISIVSLGFIYFKASDFWKPAAFFKDRVGMVDDRISTFSGLEGEEGEDKFVIQQRKAGLRAFRENPILGVGYGGFTKWEGNPTRHEMHSTPTRFLAEMGLVGVVLYAWWMAAILWTALKVWWSNRRGPYDAASAILLVGISSVSVSAIYNRQMTDRMFWLLFVFGLAMEAWTVREARARRTNKTTIRRTPFSPARVRM